MVTGNRARHVSHPTFIQGAVLAAVTCLAACALEAGEGPEGIGDAMGSEQALEGVFRIRAAHSDKCLAVAQASTMDRARVQQLRCADEDSQRFEVREAGGGRHEIVALHSDKCLDVAGASTSDGAVVQQYRCASVDQQRWLLEADGSGQYAMRSVRSDKCIDVAGRSTEDGASVQQWRCHGGSNQRFRLEPVDAGDGDGDDDDDDEGGDDEDGTSGPGEPPLPSCLRTVQVASTDELRGALSRVRAGDCLELANGRYTFPEVRARGTEAAPIVIRARQTLGAVVESGNLALSGAAHVVVQGLHFRSSGSISLNDCDHCRISRFRIERRETGGEVDWVSVRGRSRDCRIDHNDFGPQTQVANMVMLAGEGSQIVQRTRIDHNYFHDVQYTGGNGWETIRAGLSGFSFSRAFTVIEHNLFERAHSDPETISVKSSDNVVRYNTMRETKGQFTLRHGNRTSVYGNYILGGLEGSGGIRVYGGDHKIYNNYLADIDGAAILVDSGRSDDNSGELRDHKVAYRVQVAFNTIVSDRGIQIGSGKPLKPRDCTVAYNVIEGNGALLRQESGTANTTFRANIAHGGSSVGSGTLRVDPELEPYGEVQRIGSTSPAIDAAGAGFDWVRDDIAGRPRQRPDIGAHERSSAPAKHKLLKREDVGPFAP